MRLMPISLSGIEEALRLTRTQEKKVVDILARLMGKDVSWGTDTKWTIVRVDDDFTASMRSSADPFVPERGLVICLFRLMHDAKRRRRGHKGNLRHGCGCRGAVGATI